MSGGNYDRNTESLRATVFTQTDPLAADVGSPYPSAYVYGNNNPIVFTDPSGFRAVGPPNGLALDPTPNPIAAADPCARALIPKGSYGVGYQGGCWAVPNGSNAVTNSSGQVGYVPAKYCNDRNDSASQCTITGYEVLNKSIVGKTLSNPIFQGVVTLAVCSATAGVGCVAVSVGFAAYNSSGRFVEDGFTAKTVGLAAVDFALAAAKLNQLKRIDATRAVGPGVVKLFPYGTNAMSEVVRQAPGQVFVKNVAVVSATGSASYVSNKVAG
jgi:hypothetical protein